MTDGWRRRSPTKHRARGHARPDIADAVGRGAQHDAGLVVEIGGREQAARRTPATAQVNVTSFSSPLPIVFAIVDGTAGADISQMADSSRDTYPSRFRFCVSWPSVIMRTYAANTSR